VKKLILLTASTVGVIAVLTAIFGSGVAAADDYAGNTYADASSALSGAGLTGVIAGRVGSRLPTDQCVVTRSESTHWMHVSGKNFGNVKGTVLLFLNCNAPVAAAGTSGNSAASPEGKAAQAAAAQAAATPAPANPSTASVKASPAKH
jgi:hypothetical protein